MKQIYREIFHFYTTKGCQHNIEQTFIFSKLLIELRNIKKYLFLDTNVLHKSFIIQKIDL